MQTMHMTTLVPVGGRSHGFGGPDSLLLTAPARSHGFGGGQHPGAPVVSVYAQHREQGRAAVAGTTYIPDMALHAQLMVEQGTRACNTSDNATQVERLYVRVVAAESVYVRLH